MNIIHLFLGFDRRIGRSPFWIGLLIVIAVEAVAMLALGVPFFPKELNPFSVRVTDFAIQLVLLYPIAAIMVKRLHDRDYPGIYAAWFIGLLAVILFTDLAGVTGDPSNITWVDYALSLVAIVVALAFLIDLGFRRGTAGDNRFGPDPLGAGTAGRGGSS
jgi:uncharacterized membrane protein YhaH (DUF805 family)